MENSLIELSKVLGYTFKNIGILQEAITHSSFGNEGKKIHFNNQRLEFLGDSILSIIVAEHLYKKYKKHEEGDLTKLRASLVCEKSLYGFSKTLSLGEYLILGKGEENTGGRERPSILADAFEAVLAAIYLDGGIDVAREFVLRFLPQKPDIILTNMLDYKTALQEIIQKNREEKIEYIHLFDSGPDHHKTFNVEVHLNSNIIGTGQGRSKKQAEQNAAKEALELMGYGN